MEQSNTAFAALFAVSFGFAIIFFITAFITVSCDCLKLRYVSHIAWNLITLITIPLFLLSSLFGLAGTAMIYLPSFLEVLLSYEGLVTIVSEDSANILDSCLNGDGSLRGVAFDDTTGYLDNFDKFYNTSYTLNNYSDSLSESTSSQVVTRTKDLYTRMQTNIALAPKVEGDANSPVTVLGDLTSLTQASYSSALDSCSGTTEDVWVSDNTSCPEGFTYIPASTPETNVGKDSCLNVREWTASSVQTRFTNKNNCNGSSNVNTVSQYVTQINKYASETSPILNDLNLELDE